MVRGWGTPLEYASGAGKNRGKIGGGVTPSFITGQPGILLEKKGVTQPVFIKRVTHVVSADQQARLSGLAQLEKTPAH